MKSTKLQTKIAKILFILVIPVLLIAVGLLGYELIKSETKTLYHIIVTLVFISYILVFTIFLILILTKYKREFELGEDKIPYLRPFAFSLFVFMTIVGLIDILIYKTFRNFHLIIIGVMMLINNLISMKKYKREKPK